MMDIQSIRTRNTLPSGVSILLAIFSAISLAIEENVPEDGEAEDAGT